MVMRILSSVALLPLCLAPDLRAASGDVDTSFNPVVNGEIESVAVGPDGKIMIGGSFTNVSGKELPGIARLLPSGQVDPHWVPPSTVAANGRTCAVFGDGSVALVAPYFQRTSVCRLKPDGSLDSKYEVRLSDGEVRAMAVDVDGNLLLGGSFNMFANESRHGYAVVEPNGTVKGKYYAFLTQTESVNSLFPRSDRSTIMGGDFFKTYEGKQYADLQKMNSGGLLDSQYRPPLIVADGKSVDCVALQNYELQRTIIGGNFTTKVGEAAAQERCLARVSSSGALDTTFNPVFTRTGGVPRVTSVVVQCDGKIIAAGDFTAVNGVARPGLVRLSASGSVDTNFAAKGAVGATGLALQADGKVLVTGTFTTINGVTRSYIARLLNDGTRDSISIRQNSIAWSRNLAMPESDVVTFEVSSDGGTTWQMLKAPARNSSGWTISSGINLPATGMIRAHAHVSSGLMNGSSGIAEKLTTYSLSPEIGVRYLSGTGSVAVLDGQTNPVSYGDVAQGSEQTKSFVISNSGTYEMKISGVELPPGFTLVDPPTFPVTVPVPQGSLTLVVRADTSSHGTIGGTMVIANDDADEGSFDFPLTATVLGPEIAMHLGDVELQSDGTQPISFAQGYQGTGQLRETVVISNQGNRDLHVSSISVGAGFTVDKPEPFLLLPGESRAIQVGPDQSVAGTLTSNLEVYSDDFDEPVFRVPLTATVLNPLLTKVVNTRTTLNRKSGLREQKLRIINTTKTAMVAGFRVIVRGLPEGVVVRNASEVLPDGSVVIVINQPLPPKGKFVLVLEYEIPKGSRVVVYPQLTTEVIINTPSAPEAVAAVVVAEQVLTVEKFERTPEGDFALTFSSVPGRLYQVEYSADGVDWKACTPTRAAGSTVRWVDSGLPNTECAPKDAPKRLYRVSELSE